MTVQYFADSNVFIYAYDQDGDAKQAQAITLIDRIGGSGELAVSTQVLREFYSVTTRKLARPLDPETAEQAVRQLARYTLVVEDPALILAAIRRSRRDRISIWDALIVEAARRAKARILYTEDLQDGRDFDGLKVENPFREQP
jgi:predicted nucleic acid-binding protein